MYSKEEIIDRLKGGLIVSCQALEDEPLHGSFIMSRMAYAAELGGAVGIRANSPKDIIDIKKSVGLPIIGLFKQNFSDSEVYITPTISSVDELIISKADIIALDATNRIRPKGMLLNEFFKTIRTKYPNQLFMADCATYEEAIYAEILGFDFVATTLSGYTKDTNHTSIPNFLLLNRLVTHCKIPVIAEGGINTPEQLKMAIDMGAHAAVVGSAITRPREITRRFVAALE